MYGTPNNCLRRRFHRGRINIVNFIRGNPHRTKQNVLFMMLLTPPLILFVAAIRGILGIYNSSDFSSDVVRHFNTLLWQTLSIFDIVNIIVDHDIDVVLLRLTYA